MSHIGVTYRFFIPAMAALLLLVPCTYAQDSGALTLDPDKAITQYQHRSWNTLDGLPQNSISAIVQSDDGYLWFGTQEGLVRYDGSTFTVYDRKNTKAFSVSTVTKLVQALDGTLWIGTRGGGVLSYKDGRFESTTSETGLTGDFVTALYADGDSSVWIGTYNPSGLNRVISGKTVTFTQEQGLPGGVISFVSRDANGDLIAGTRTGVFVFDGQGFSPHSDPVLAEAFVTTFFVDADGAEWVGFRDGTFLHRQNGETRNLSAHVASDGSYLKAVWQDSEHSLWFGFRGSGLYRYANGKFSSFKEEQGLSSNSISVLMEDREGGLWVGTSNGLDRFQDGKFDTYTTMEGLTHDDASSVYEDINGTIWVGTRGGGVSKYFNGSFSTIGTAQGLSSDIVQAVEGDRSGNVWVGTADAGLNLVTPTGIKSFSMEDGLSGNQIYALYTDSGGKLWIGTEGGLSIYDGHGFKNYTTEEGLSSPFVTAFAERAEGGMWIATYDGGLNLLVGDSIQVFTQADGLLSDQILSLYADDSSTLWVGTYGYGLNIVRHGKITGIDSGQGLFDDTISSILEDDQGLIWFSSNKGIFSADRAELLSVASGNSESLYSVNYGVADGLKTAEANGGVQPAAWKSADGRLWFPMTHGIASIDPSEIRRNNVLPPVEIKGLVVDSETLSLDGIVELRAGSDKLEFDYTALSFTAPEKVSYETMLVGHDEEWYATGNRRETFYTNLDPGTYTFRVRASNNDGLWNEQGAELTFTLKPFFYQTTWFLIVSILAGLLAAYTTYRMRVRHMKARERELEQIVDERTRDLRREKEITERAKEVIEDQAEKLKELDKFKTRFFSNVSHEFRTPLTMLIGPLENALLGTYGEISDSMRMQSEIMLRNARRLMRLINQLLDLSKLEAGKMQLKTQARNIVPFLEGMLFTFTPFAENKNIDLEFESESEDIEVYFEPDKLEKVFYNLLSNAAKFTPENGDISVLVRMLDPSDDFKKGLVEIRVKDNGKGISAADLPYIFDRFRQAEGSKSKTQQGTGIGLSLVKELVALHRGKIRVESTVGEGTEFVISMHLGKQHLAEDEIVEASSGEIENDAMNELATNSLNFIHDDEGFVTSTNTHLRDDAPTVLVVEDNKDVREYIAEILGSEYRILQAVDGQDGLEKAIEFVPDLVLSDVSMPRMDGNEMCRIIKEDARLDHIPVLLLTARASFEGKMSGLKVGADDYMTKPFNARELLIRVRNLIKLRMQDRELKQLNGDLEKKVRDQLDQILTERKEYEQSLIVERDRAEASSLLKSSILDNINHEFRTPLSTIIGYSQILIEEAPEELQEFANTIEEGGQRLLKTLNGVIDLANLESTDYESDKQKIDAVMEARRALDSIRGEAEDKGLRVHLNFRTGEKFKLNASPKAISKVLNALLDNALKYTNEGEILLTVSRTSEFVEFAVQDTGCGIEKSLQEEIFKTFVQADGGLTRSHQGCGIGLSIARRLADRIDGSLHVKSVLGEGSTFTFRIPGPRLTSGIGDKKRFKKSGMSEASPSSE